MSQTRRPRNRRFGVLAVVIAVAVAGMVARLAFVQVIDGAKYASYGRSEVEQQVALPASRGPIYDRNGDLLAISVDRQDVVADDFLVTDASATASALAPLLHQPADKLVPLLQEQSGYVLLARKVTDATMTQIKALGLSSISFVPDSLRVETASSVFQPLLGGVYANGDGDAGVELDLDHLLSGVPGHETIGVAPGGVALPGAPSDVVSPKQGEGAVLTIDEPLQIEVTKDVAAQMEKTHSESGIAVVENVHTGAILAMVDLCVVSGTASACAGAIGRKGSIVAAPTNLALTSIYQPGSVMKLATVSYALQDGVVTPTTPFTVPYTIQVGGYTFEDADFHGTEVLPVSQILAQSSNVGTIEIAQRLGMTRLGEAFNALGFTRASGLDWPGESSGIVGIPATWFGSAQASVPIGTGVAVTPMQILDAYNSVANGGVLVEPRLLQATVSGNGVEHAVKGAAPIRDLDTTTIAPLVGMLEGVVQDGTAVAACIPGYTVAGKTGTAQVPNPSGGYIPGDFNATFVGFVPAQAPQLSGIVVLNNPTPIYGGTVSAPVFSTFMSYALKRFNIRPAGPGGTHAQQGACANPGG